jgi:uncharacterized damage-inducible protein DinB
VEEYQDLTSSVYEGWHRYQSALLKALRSLEPDQLTLRAAPHLRSVGEIARHMVGARARWFQSLVGDEGEEFAILGKWDRRGAPERSAEELVSGLERSWQVMQDAIKRWSREDWEQTYSGEDDSEPDVFTRRWVIWHLIEHDLHHGGEVSLTLGTHGVRAVDL